MSPNCNIVRGDFLGGELEGGTFHHWIPPEDLLRTGQETDPAPDERAARPTATAADVLTDADTELEVVQPQM
jgi:hypothetical protein